MQPDKFTAIDSILNICRNIYESCLLPPVLRMFDAEGESTVNVRINPALCVGCGLCEENMPELFIIQNQIAHIIPDGLAGADRTELQNMIEDCPAEAISAEPPE